MVEIILENGMQGRTDARHLPMGQYFLVEPGDATTLWVRGAGTRALSARTANSEDVIKVDFFRLVTPVDVKIAVTFPK